MLIRISTFERTCITCLEEKKTAMICGFVVVVKKISWHYYMYCPEAVTT